MLRRLRHHPAFAGSLIAVLAVGVAVTTAMFSIVYGVLLRELPYPDADRLVTLASTDPRTRRPSGRRRRRLLRLAGAPAGVRAPGDGAAGHRVEPHRLGRAGAACRRAGHGEPVRHARRDTDPGPLLRGGRGARTGAASSVVILSHALWQRRFGGDPSIVGRTIQLNGRGHEVVGVMGPSFHYPSREIQAWGALYIPPAALALRRDYSYLTVARLKPGVSVGAGRGAHGHDRAGAGARASVDQPRHRGDRHAAPRRADRTRPPAAARAARRRRHALRDHGVLDREPGAGAAGRPRAGAGPARHARCEPAAPRRAAPRRAGAAGRHRCAGRSRRRLRAAAIDRRDAAGDAAARRGDRAAPAGRAVRHRADRGGDGHPGARRAVERAHVAAARPRVVGAPARLAGDGAGRGDGHAARGERAVRDEPGATARGRSRARRDARADAAAGGRSRAPRRRSRRRRVSGTARRRGASRSRRGGGRADQSPAARWTGAGRRRPRRGTRRGDRHELAFGRSPATRRRCGSR